MLKKVILFIHHIIFIEIGPKFPAGFLKVYIDRSISIFEKIANRFEILSNIYIYPYYDLVTKEIKTAKINPGSSILVIGCGAIPITSIILAEKTDSKITAIDTDSEVYILASHYIKKHNLHKKIKIKYTNDILYSVKDFDIIFISYGIKKERALMKHLYENIKENTKIIYRVSRDFENKKNNLFELFKIEDKIRTDAFGPMDSYVLLKKTYENTSHS
jgi:precorrin-6B methylase 2